jgi:hypothetical protein
LRGLVDLLLPQQGVVETLAAPEAPARLIAAAVASSGRSAIKMTSSSPNAKLNAFYGVGRSGGHVLDHRPAARTAFLQDAQDATPRTPRTVYETFSRHLGIAPPSFPRYGRSPGRTRPSTSDRTSRLTSANGLRQSRLGTDVSANDEPRSVRRP